MCLSKSFDGTYMFYACQILLVVTNSKLNACQIHSVVTHSSFMLVKLELHVLKLVLLQNYS